MLMRIHVFTLQKWYWTVSHWTDTLIQININASSHPRGEQKCCSLLRKVFIHKVLFTSNFSLINNIYLLVQAHDIFLLSTYSMSSVAILWVDYLSRSYRFVCRYYAICCQPLVYRNKMTPMRVALMIGGCWVIPTFISFLPIMQGWNSIGIDHLVSAAVCVHVGACGISLQSLGWTEMEKSFWR